MTAEERSDAGNLQDQLREFFRLDKQVRGMRSRLDAAIDRARAQQTRREQLQQQHDELSDQLRQMQAGADSLERQTADMDQRIEQTREQMNTVKTNKEYSALLTEVNTLKADKGKLEDQALERMGEAEDLKQQFAEVERKLEERSRLETASDSEVQAARDEVGDQLDKLTARRDEAAENVPDDALAAFNRLADNYEGEAMAPIEEQDRRRMEYTCGGCFMSLPVERVNAVMTRLDMLTTCPACGRILYMDRELKEAIAPK